MSDYDVGAVSLSSPPPSAVIQSYRPAVLVKNNGVHDALAVGSLRIYGPAGLLLFTSEIYSGVIAPGETKPAQATDYWTPTVLGRHQVIAYVSCINDQNPANDNLPPCFVQIIPGEPTPPTPIAMHAAQHEEGGGDELNVDGLHGRLTDAQTALAHKASHQAAGSDQLDVTGLPGILAQGQPIADHHESHENHGGDELNVEGLYGVLQNLQKPKVHANEAHDPNYSAKPHGNADHDPDFTPTPHGNVHHDPHFQPLASAAYLREVDAPPIIYVNALATGTPLDVDLPTDSLDDGDVLYIELLAMALLASGGQPDIQLEIKHGSGDWHTLATLPVPIFNGNPDQQLLISIHGSIPVFTEEESLVFQPVIECDFWRDQAEATPVWSRTRNNYTTHPFDPTEVQRLRVRYITPAGDNWTAFILSTLSRARPNRPEDFPLGEAAAELPALKAS
jgi:hypothetical protein